MKLSAVLALALGVAALVLRPFTTGGTVAAMSTIGIIGVLGPVPPRGEEFLGRTRWLAAMGLGIAAFAVARVLRPPHVGPVTLLSVALATLAALAEEAFFRRLMYAWVAGAGPWLAIGATAFAFAAVHVPGYGIKALPVDFAAGLLFGWQRWATGGWAASAVTHVTANLLQVR